MRLAGVAILAFAALGSRLAHAADDAAGLQVFTQNCAVCHEKAVDGGRIPTLATLRKLPAATIVRTLESGVMSSQGSNLSAAEKLAVAGYLGTASVTAMPVAQNRCAGGAWKASAADPKWDGWGLGPENRRYQEHGGLAATSVPKLKVKWAFAFPDVSMMRSQPAVYGGRVFIGSADGGVFALDAKTGCEHWRAKASSQIRSGIAIAITNGKALVLTGDAAATVTAFDAGSGQVAWSRRVDESPYAMVTSTPLVRDGKIYIGVSSREESEAARPGYACCTFRGSFLALNAADGAVLWKTWTIEAPAARGKNRKGAEVIAPSGAGVWATPTYDSVRNLLYVLTGDNYSDPATDTSDALLAVSPADGTIVWMKQFTKGDSFNVACFTPDKSACPEANGPDHDFGASAILVNLGGGKRALLLGQKSGVMHAVDPDRKGEILWEERIGKGGPLGGIQWGPASDGNRVYIALSDFTEASGTGGLFALSVKNGERLWQAPNKFCEGKPGCRPAQSGAVTVLPGAVFSGSLDGHLRAYSGSTGAVLWDYDAVHEFTTVNGVKGQGGSFDGGGPVVAGGMVFAGSGYNTFGGLPGNVLLAFGPE